MSTRSRLRSWIVGALALVLAFGMTAMPNLSAPAWAADRSASVGSYAPEGTRNVALEATISASEAGEAAHPVTNLINGKNGVDSLNLWVAAGGNEGGWVNLDLQQSETIQKVVVFPRGDAGYYGVYYPAKFTVSLLDQDDNVVWDTTVSHENSSAIGPGLIDSPDVIEVPAVAATSIRLDVIERHQREGKQLQLSQIAVFADGEPGEPEPEAPTLEDLRPEGTVNLALDAQIDASSSYEMANESWALKFLHDGVTGTSTGWSTNPHDKVQDPAGPAWVVADFVCPAEVSRIVVAPRDKNFPSSYRIELSSDGENWETVSTSNGNPTNQSEMQVHDLDEPTLATQVRMYVDLRNGPDSKDGYLVQLSELAIFGTGTNCLNLQQVKGALLMPPGATDSAWFETQGTGDVPAEFVVSTSDESVATVDTDGTITAVAPGKATITLSMDETEMTVPVEVSEDIPQIGSDFLISLFWPPTKDYVNEEQYGYLADAGINLVQSTHTGDLVDRDTNMEMARLSAENGIFVSVADKQSGGNIPTMSAEELDNWINQYVHVPGVGSLYLIDEPGDATQFASAFNRVRDVASNLYPHMNFFPYYFYGSEQKSQEAMRAWLESTGGVRASMDVPDYLMYDLYPFLTNSTNLAGMFANLDSTREVGLEYNIKTGTYLQSVGIYGPYRRPVETEIRYEANVAMAYGYKQLSYFTWWTPTDRGAEEFTDAIMSPTGEKTDLYEPVKQLNSEIHALGPTLMRLDATDVYLNGNTYGRASVPEDFLVQALTDDDLVLSHMVDRETGEEYVFVVNNSFEEAVDTTLAFTDEFGSVREVSRVDGSIGSTVALEDGTLALSLPAGEGVLYALGGEVEPEPTYPELTEFTFDPATAEVEADQNAAVNLVIDAETGNAFTRPLSWKVNQVLTRADTPVLEGDTADDCVVDATGRFVCEVSLPAGKYEAVLSYDDYQYEQTAQLTITTKDSGEDPNGGDEGDKEDGSSETGDKPSELPVTGAAITGVLLLAAALGAGGYGLTRVRGRRE